MKNKSENRSMTEGIIWKQLLFFAIPLFLSSILQQFYGIIDSLFVGNFVGDLALAAVGSTGSLVNLLVGFFLGLSAGAGVVIANSYGAADAVRMEKAKHTAILVAAICGVALTLLGWILTPVLLRFMNTPDGVYELAIVYLRLYFLGMIPMLIYNVGAGIMRSIGNSREPMMILLFCGIFHIFADYLFITLWKMGVAGAAYATGLSQLLSAVWVMWRLVRSDGPDRLEWQRMKIDMPVLRSIIRVSVPTGFQSSMYSIANLMIQSYINMFGSVAMAGSAAYFKIDNFVFSPVTAMGLAVTTFVSQNVGAGRFDRIQRAIRNALMMAFSFSVFLAVIVILFRYPILGWFTKSPAVIETGILFIFYLIPFYPIHNLTEVLSGTIRGAGNATTPMVITIFCIGIFRIVWVLIMTHFWFDLRMVIVSFPISWILCAACFCFYYKKNATLITRKTL